MADHRYEHQGDPSIRLIEECSELIQALCKIERFGLDSVCPPEGGKPSEVGLANHVLLEKEMEDVSKRIAEMRELLKSHYVGLEGGGG